MSQREPLFFRLFKRHISVASLDDYHIRMPHVVEWICGTGRRWSACVVYYIYTDCEVQSDAGRSLIVWTSHCPAATPGYLAYEFRLRHYDDLLHDPSDAGRIIDGAGDLIVRATSGSGREGSWFQYYPRSNQEASAFAPHADGHVAGRLALSGFEKSLVVGRLSPQLSEPEWTRTSLMPSDIGQFENCFQFCAEFLRSDQNFNTKCYVTSAAEFAAHIHLMTRSSNTSPSNAHTRICIQVNVTDASVRLQQGSTRVNLSSLGCYLQVSDASFPFEEWQEKLALAALHLSRHAVSTACGDFNPSTPILGAAHEHARLLLFDQPMDRVSAARCERWGLDINRNRLSAFQRLQMLRMSGFVRVLVRAFAGDIVVLSRSRKVVRFDADVRQQCIIAAWVARRVTGANAMQFLLCMRHQQHLDGAVEPLQTHTIVPMDVARSDDVVIHGGRRHGTGWLCGLIQRFCGRASYARFDDGNGAGGNEVLDIRRSDRGVAAHMDGSGWAAGLWRDALNFRDDFRYSKQLGSLYRLRLFSNQCWGNFSVCFTHCLYFLWEINWSRWLKPIAKHFANIFLLLTIFGTGIFLFLPFFFLIPVQDTGNHVGPSVIQGNCSTPRNRCDIASQCEMQSSDTYSCSCPDWLTGSGFDDDPCICHYSFFPVPDFKREICVTRMSHLTLGWWVAFMYGTNACLLFGFCFLYLRFEGSSSGNSSLSMCSTFCLVLGLCMIIPVALVGMGQPKPDSLCGGIKCSVGYTCIDNACVLADCSPGFHMDGGRCCPDHTHAVDGVCVAGDIGDCKSAATLAQCDRGAHCFQLDEKHFGCQCPNFMWDWHDDALWISYTKGDTRLRSNSDFYACNTNFSCAIEKGMVMGYADNPCRCRTFSPWGNQFVPDYERKVCVDKQLRLKFWDWITFNWLVGTADIFIIVYTIIFACNCYCEETCSTSQTRVVRMSIVVSICALFHGLVFGLGLGPAIKTPCGSSALDFKLCGANQQCVNNSCV